MSQIADDMGCEAPSADDANAAFEEIDADKSGKICLDEFKALIRQVLEAMQAGAE